MLRRLIFISISAGFVLLFAGRVLAFDPNQQLCQLNGASNSAYCTPPPLSGPEEIITKITNIVLFITGIAAVIAIIFGGIQYILSDGDSAKINAAKNTILYAVIGLVVALLAKVIVSFVVRRT